jgi:hypothetical protein
MRILRQKPPPRSTVRPERRIYTEAVQTALIMLWEALATAYTDFDRVYGKPWPS